MADFDKYRFGLFSQNKWDDEPLGRFDAFFPIEDSNGLKVASHDIPQYIRLTLDGSTHILKTSVKNSQRCNIAVNSSVYAGEEIANILFKAATQRQFDTYKLGKDKNQKLALQGLGIAVAGILIDSTFAIGKVDSFVIWRPSGLMTGVILIGAAILKIWGLILVYTKGLREAK